MVQTKSLRGATGCALLACLLLAPLLVEAQESWETLTSFRSVRRMAVIQDTLYVATAGGLLLIDTVTQPGREYLHTDGLGTTNLFDITSDPEQRVWLAGSGRLVRLQDGSPRQYPFSDRDGLPLVLYALENDDDYLWVGTGIGLVLFSKEIDGGQIEDSYTRFGTLNPSPNVYDIAMRNDTIWLATSSGLAMAPSGNPLLLKSPLTWTTFDAVANPELGSDTIRAVELFAGDLYVATSDGAFRFEPGVSDTAFAPVAFAQNRVVTDMVAEEDSLFIYHSGGLGVVTSSGAVAAATTGLRRAPVTGIRFEDARWVGMSDSGIYANENGPYDEYPFTGAPGTDAHTIAVSPDGVITAGFGTRIFAQFDGQAWLTRPIYAGDSTMDLLVDPNGRVWTAGWGSGVWRLEPDTQYQYKNTNSSLMGISGAEGFVVVRSLATDGNVFVASLFQAANGAVVGYVPFDLVDDPAAWRSIGVAEGITNELTTAIAYRTGQLAVGTMSGGVYVYDTTLVGGPIGTYNAPLAHYTDDNSRLISNSIRALRHAPNGELWIGTNLGISRWDWGTERLVDVVLPPGVSSDVTSIVFDGIGNAFIGTRAGLAYLDATTGEQRIHTTRTSPLVADDIRDLWYDQAHADLYIATAGGISILDLQLDVATTTLDSVVPVPNPFVIRSSTDRLHFNLDRPATVKIYSIAGESIVEFPIALGWDGRNDRGERVASGAYFYVITDESGALHRGKVLLIREQ